MTKELLGGNMPKRMKRFNVEKTPSYVRATLEELEDFANAHLTNYELSSEGPIELESLIDDAHSDVCDAANRLEGNDPGGPNYRATLVKVAARAIALLALDELNRGSRAIKKDMKEARKNDRVVKKSL